MTSAPLPQPRFRASRTLRAFAFGLAIAALPAFADNLADAQRLIKRGDYAQALESVNAQLAETPNEAKASFLKGVIYTETNQTAEAIAVFTKLTEDYPEMPEPYNNLAVLYARQKLYDKARMALELAIQANPSYAVAYENLGDLHAKLASQAYARAVQLDTNGKSAKIKLALANDLIKTPGKPAGR
jgi:Flp pilus assembly protein TadD